MPVTPQDQVAASYEFAQIAVQYHATGRFAALNGCIPVAGNLLHHAAEMYLKCSLVRTIELPKLKKLGHSLPALWQAFVRQHPVLASGPISASIRELDKFEQLRYPNVAVATSYQVSIVQNRAQYAQLPTGPQPPYHLVLEDVDEIASLAAKSSGLQPNAFAHALRPEPMHYLLVGNMHLAGVA